MIECIEKSWINIAKWSPSKDDVVIRRDRYGKPIRAPANSPKKYEEIRVKAFTETDDDVHDIWRSECAEIIDEHCTKQNRRIPCISTFVKYRPNHVKHRPHHSQFGCEKCVHFRFQHQALHQKIAHHHQCGTRCTNYRVSMGKTCTCNQCTNCILLQLQEVPRADLLHELCCKQSIHLPGIRCAMGDCINPRCIRLGSLYEKLLQNGIGCSTWTEPSDQVNVKYRVYAELSNKSIHKKRWTLVWREKPWREFKNLYLKTLREYVGHQFNKQRQSAVRYKLANELNGMAQLPSNTLFTSMDFIQNVRLKPTAQTHATQTSLFDIQILAVYDVCNINNKLQKRAYYFLSDMKHKGWHSAVPAYRAYLKQRKREFAQRGETLKHNSFWADRGPGDTFNAGFIGYASDDAHSEGVDLCVNTSGVNHGKYIHDQIGGDGGRLIKKVYRSPKFILREGESPAQKFTIYCNTNCRVPKKKKHKGVLRYFVYVPFTVIRYVLPCPIDTFPCGIKQFHCLYIDSSKQLWVRPNSCCCAPCLRGDHAQCKERRWCGTMRKAVGGIPENSVYIALHWITLDLFSFLSDGFVIHLLHRGDWVLR